MRKISGDFPDTGSPDHVLIDDRDRLRRFGQVLTQARRGKDRGKFGEELALGEILGESQSAASDRVEQHAGNRSQLGSLHPLLPALFFMASAGPSRANRVRTRTVRD